MIGGSFQEVIAVMNCQKAALQIFAAFITDSAINLKDGWGYFRLVG
jgi:hypothetical protein